MMGHASKSLLEPPHEPQKHRQGCEAEDSGAVNTRVEESSGHHLEGLKNGQKVSALENLSQW